MSDVLQDLAKRGTKILQDSKTPKQSKPPVAKKLPQPVEAPRDIHESFVRKTVVDKPKKQVILDFFQEVIDMESKKL